MLSSPQKIAIGYPLSAFGFRLGVVPLGLPVFLKFWRTQLIDATRIL
jgi:hypothetical protein